MGSGLAPGPMVDWDLVEKRRAKGWEWDRIAEDPKVDFHAEEGAGDPGRALRALYYQRRSRGRRAADDSSPGGPGGAGGGVRKPRLIYIGYGAFSLALVWFLLAYAVPAPIGTFIAAIPWLGLLLAACGFLLAFALLGADERWNRGARASVIVGLVLGVAIAGALGGVAYSLGCPTLSASKTGEPDGWARAANAHWTESGVPVFFFYGSIACPYCSASSWAMAGALEAFGQLSGYTYGHSDSNPNDIPHTPEIILTNAQLVSPYVALHVDEATDDNNITLPSTPACPDGAYVSAYDTNGIPFNVVGGVFLHTGTIVDPTQLRIPAGDASGTPLTPQQVAGEMSNQSGTAWNAIWPGMAFIEAIIVYLNNGQPTSVANNATVAADLKLIH
jgi:hypothetical protein